MAAKQTDALKELRERIQLQNMLANQQKYAPVNNIGEGIGQGADIIAQSAMQMRQQKMLADLLAQEKTAQEEALKAKVQALTPIAQKAGMDVQTFMALPEGAQTALTTQLGTQRISEEDILNKANALQNSITMPQEGLTLDDAGRIPLEQTTGMMNLPLLDEQQALDLVRTGGDKPLVDALGTARAYQLKDQALNAMVPDRGNINGQKAYLNAFQGLQGFAPVTDAKLNQEQATLQSTLLGNENQAIQNHYLPAEKRLGLANSDLDITGKSQTQTWTPILNAAGLESTQAGTTGKLIENQDAAGNLQLKEDIIGIMQRTDMPIDQRAALVSAIPGADSRIIMQNLKDLSSKEGILGVKSKDFKYAFDKLSKEADRIKNPPKPAAPKPQLKPAQQLGAMTKQAVNAAPTIFGGLARQLPIVGPALHFGDTLKALPQQFGQAQNFMKEFGQGFSSIAQPTLPTQKPVTLPGIQKAKTSAMAGANAADKRIQTNMQAAQGLATLGQKAQGVQSLYDAVAAAQAKREAEARQYLKF